MKRPRPILLDSVVARGLIRHGDEAVLHAPVQQELALSIGGVAVGRGQDLDAMRSTLALRGLRSRLFSVDALLYNTQAVIDAALLDGETVAADGTAVESAAVGASCATDEELVDVPDALPPDEDWVTPAKLRGFQRPGTGRELGSGLHVRVSLAEVSAVIFCRDVLSVVLRDGLVQGFHFDAVERVNELREKLAFYSDKKMNGRVFSMAPIGHVGLVAKFGRNGPRTKDGLDQAAAIELSLVQDQDDDVVCACSCAEQCLRVTCMFANHVQRAFVLVSNACGVQPAQLLRIFHSRLGQPRSEGDGHLFGDALCGVRSVGGNWPWALVRKSRANFWTCMSCTEQGLACTHAEAARLAVSEAAAVGAADEEADNEEEPMESMTRLEKIKFKYRKSHRPRSAVPSVAAFLHDAELRRHALLHQAYKYTPMDSCPSCGTVFLRGGHRGQDAARVEFEDGAADCWVKWWLCSFCDLKVMADGDSQGVIFSSPNTGFTEVFLFNVAYGLVANGSSLTGSAQLRGHLVELAGGSRFPSTATDLRVLKVLRQGVMLYLELVVTGMPRDVLRCKVCALPDGSYKVLCFDGLYQGIRAKHRRDMVRIKVPLNIAAGAVAACSLVYNNQVVLALSCGLRHARADSKAKFEALRFKSIGAVKGAAYAIAAVHPDALRAVEGVGADLGVSPGLWEDAAGQVLFDPVRENKMHPALVQFMRTVLLGTDVALILARAVMDSPRDIRTKLPASVLSLLKRLTDAPDQTAEQDPPPQCPDRRRAAVFDEPALADTGGDRGASRARRPKIALHSSFPTTINAAPKVVSFVRALCAETVFPWCTSGDWGAVQLLMRTLDDGGWSEDALEVTLRDPRVRELRVLRGAVACLVPAMVALPHVRRSLQAVLGAVVDTAVRYNRFIQADRAAVVEGDPPLTRMAVADGHTGRSISPTEFEDLWLQPLLPSSLRAAYGDERVDAASDYHQSGVFCPLLPPLRPGLDFVNNGRRTEEDSTCEKGYGCADGWTPGSFGVFCCCSHPKCVAVIMMDGHEGPRMPLDFIVSRLPSLPSSVIYDFACGTHKAAACRVPRVARLVNTCVDAFHFRSSHKTCSNARCPTSYESLLGVNTSSSEQRNAASRRLKQFITLLNQRNFLTFSAYQQSISNIMAMYREACDEVGPAHRLRSIGWPLWYRETHLGGESERKGE